jgi:hypothetical protein
MRRFTSICPLSPLVELAAKLGGAVELRPIGRLGIHLIRELIDGARFTRTGVTASGCGCAAGAKSQARRRELPAPP